MTSCFDIYSVSRHIFLFLLIKANLSGSCGSDNNTQQALYTLATHSLAPTKKTVCKYLRIFISINLQLYVTPGSTSHIAAAFDRNHDQDSGTHAMLMKLKQLLNVYHQMDNEAPRYPWPSPPTVKFTSEEFQKLRNCRYLRLTKSNIESLQQLQKKVQEQNG